MLLALADPPTVTHDLSETLVGTAQIVFFLMGAMTIVEVVDAHKGFDVVTTRIKTNQLAALTGVGVRGHFFSECYFG